MKKYAKLGLIALVFCCATYLATADRGGFGKRTKVHLNITTINTLKNSIPFNLHSGLSYKGSSVMYKTEIGNSVFNNSIITYQKGNTVNIVPYKQKVLIPSYSAATGYKLIIRPK